MRVLLDEQIPVDFADHLQPHDVRTVRGCGWSGLRNGHLLRRASGHFDVLVTMDRSLEHQQNLRVLPFGVVVIRAKSNRLSDLFPLIDGILLALEELAPGTVRHVNT